MHPSRIWLINDQNKSVLADPGINLSPNIDKLTSRGRMKHSISPARKLIKQL